MSITGQKVQATTLQAKGRVCREHARERDNDVQDEGCGNRGCDDSRAAFGHRDAGPKVLMLHQWASGNDAASIAKLGEMFTAAGGEWQQTAIAGHTANTLAKLRADVVAGNAPAAVQLKGPEIAEWNAHRRHRQHG